MITSVLTNSRWQPPILQLLPFSENYTVPDPHRPKQSQVSAASSCRTVRSSPILAAAMSDMVNKSHTKSSPSRGCNDSPRTAVNDNITNPREMHRVPTQSPEKLMQTDSPYRGSNDSDNSVHSGHKTVSRAFRFRIKDVNVQSTGRSKEDSHLTFGETKTSNTHFCKDMVKSLPRPTFKPADTREFYSSKKYLNKSITTFSEGELERKQPRLFQTGPCFQNRKIIKVNAKELPRSQTPFVENDPDKLNMEHVIAFLQSSEDDQGSYEKSEASSKQVVLKPQSQFSKRLPLSSALLSNTGQNGAFFDQKQKVIKQSLTSTNSNNISARVKLQETNQPEHVSTRQKCSSESSNKASRLHTTHLDKTHMQSEYGEKTPEKRADGYLFIQHSYKTVPATLSQLSDQQQRPKSLDMSHYALEVKEGHLPSITSKLQNNKIVKPFSLHRIVSQGHPVPGHTTSASHQSPRDQDAGVYDAGFQKTVPESSKSVWRMDKTDTRFKPPERPFYDVTYSPTGNRLSNDKDINGHERRSSLKYVHNSNVETEHNQKPNKVINLPTAHVEADSDEDSSPLLTAPNAGSKQKLTLSTTGSIHCSDKMNTAKQNQVAENKTLNSVAENKTLNSVVQNKTLNSVAENKTLTNHNGQETVVGVYVEEMNRVFNTTPAVNSNSQIESLLNAPLDELQTDCTERKTGRQADFSPAAAEENRTEKETLSTSFLLNTHQKTFIRLLNQELATLKRTTWIDHRNNIISPFLYKNQLPDNVKSSPAHIEKVRLSLRKERSKTRFHTYMTDMQERTDNL